MTSTTTPLLTPTNASSRLFSCSMLSSSEMQYILEGCRDNIRLDGRARNDIRDYTTLLQSPLVSSNGSARILSGTTTHVLCSVKADLVHASPNHPNQGTVELHVDTLLQASGRQQARVHDELLSSLLMKLLLLNNNNNLEGLVVVPHSHVWRLAIDVLVLSHNGSLVDVCSRVIRAALQTTKLPYIIPFTNTKGEMELNVDGDIHKAVDISWNCPICVTVLVLPGNVLVVDATLEEEACAVCQVRVAIDCHRNVRAVHNQGPLLFSLKDDILATAIQASEKMFSQEKMATTASERDDDSSLLQTQYRFR